MRPTATGPPPPRVVAKPSSLLQRAVAASGSAVLIRRATKPIAPREGWVEFEVDSVLDHEVVVLES